MQNLKRRMKGYRHQLRKFRSRRDAYGIGRYNAARWEYLKLLEQQEVYWKQRAKQFWLREGDQNTRFFHKYASTWRQNNRIIGLHDSSGNWVETDDQIQEVIT